jgi:hypothetical protein
MRVRFGVSPDHREYARSRNSGMAEAFRGDKLINGQALAVTAPIKRSQARLKFVKVAHPIAPLIGWELLHTEHQEAFGLYSSGHAGRDCLPQRRSAAETLMPG